MLKIKQPKFQISLAYPKVLGILASGSTIGALAYSGGFSFSY